MSLPSVRHPELGRWIGWILQLGTLAAIGLVAVGYGWAVLTGDARPDAAPVLDELRHGGGDAMMALGLLTLTLVPVAVVIAAVVAFVRAGERRMAGTAFIVLALLLGSLGTAAALATVI